MATREAPPSRRTRRPPPKSRRATAPFPEPVTDPVESAASAGLRYLSDASPGIRRRWSGAGFRYVGPDGKRITDRTTLGRIESLAIPPAWTDVWISPWANGHLQATGRDARGRKQYRYHPRWREARDETKFSRMLAFAAALPGIRAGVERDLALPGLPKDKVLATVVRLLECTGIRVGNDEYARQNKSYGLTTLKDRHVRVDGSTLRFSFKGKSGIRHAVDLTDRRLARIVERCQALPGEELFRYFDDAGTSQTIGSEDVNDYLRRITGQDFTAKDFRTWAGTVLAVRALQELGPAESARERARNVIAAIDRVADRLRNTRAICRRYYIHPAVLETYEDGGLAGAVGRRRGAGAPASEGAGLEPDERAVVAVLEERLAGSGGA
ncbi:MAG TPA: hypothetical protein VNK43_11725 [Gemmatimonadales bacterium]|nr:hypothetical protein [Gemmatimonadales bacterium]